MAKKILIIDDEPELVNTIRLRLEQGGYEVVSAADGHDGFRKVEAERPDLIILDIIMPRVDGFEFFKMLKKDPRKSGIPVLVLTARGGMKDTFQSMNVGGFMAKPFDQKELIGMVESLLTKRALVLSSHATVTEKIQQGLLSCEYAADVVSSEEEMVSKGIQGPYKLLIAYLAEIRKEPPAFLTALKVFKNRDIKVLCYSDSLVKGTEDNNTLSIDDLHLKWTRAGAHGFFDPRTTTHTLVDEIAALGA